MVDWIKRPRVFTFLIIVVLFVAIITLYGFFGTGVRGKIIDRRTKKPLANAVIKIGDKHVKTNKEGFFLAKISWGKKKVVASAPGYEKYQATKGIPLFFSKNLEVLELQNGILIGKATEDIVSPQAVSNLTLSTAHKSFKIGLDGKVKIFDIPVGLQKIVAEAPEHEKYEKSINIRGGVNKIDILLSLTPEATAKRQEEAAKQKNYGFIYDTTHPDRQAQWGTKAEYLTIMEKKEQAVPRTITNYVVQTSLFLPTWTDPVTGKTYQNVVRVPVSTTVSSPILAIFGSTEYTFIDSSYFSKVGGRWLSLGTGEPVAKETEL